MASTTGNDRRGCCILADQACGHSKRSGHSCLHKRVLSSSAKILRRCASWNDPVWALQPPCRDRKAAFVQRCRRTLTKHMRMLYFHDRVVAGRGWLTPNLHLFDGLACQSGGSCRALIPGQHGGLERTCAVPPGEELFSSHKHAPAFARPAIGTGVDFAAGPGMGEHSGDR